MAKKKLSPEARKVRIRALENAIDRHSKSILSNVRLMASAIYDEDYLEAEMRRRHANESFEQVQALIVELDEIGGEESR